MEHSHRHLTARPTDFWLARGAILVIAMLQIGLVNDLAVGPRWLAPGLELADGLDTDTRSSRIYGCPVDQYWPLPPNGAAAGYRSHGNLHVDEFWYARSFD
jgi:hypothetical protein